MSRNFLNYLHFFFHSNIFETKKSEQLICITVDCQVILNFISCFPLFRKASKIYFIYLFIVCVCQRKRGRDWPYFKKLIQMKCVQQQYPILLQEMLITLDFILVKQIQKLHIFFLLRVFLSPFLFQSYYPPPPLSLSLFLSLPHEIF